MLIISAVSALSVFAASGPSAPFASLPGADSLQQAWSAIQRDSGVADALRSRDVTLTHLQTVAGAGIETVKFQNFYKGVQVLGSTVSHHRGPRGVISISDDLARFDLDVRPAVSRESAVALAKGEAGDKVLKGAPTLKILPSDNSDSAKLIYWVTLEGTAQEAGADLLIDAHTGETIAEISHHMTIAPIEVIQANDLCETVNADGAPVSLRASLCDHTVTNGVAAPEADASARRALSNARRTLEYYQSVHNRNSFDNRGASLVNIVHIGEKFDNAFWNSDMKVMAYGDGDGTETGDFTLSADVAGHEMTHAVTSSTADLIYMGQSGALNEAYSDIFGKMIADDGDWAMGKALYLDRANAKGIRNLADPRSLNAKYRDDEGNRLEKPYPAHMDERFVTTSVCSRRNDNCWVHVNSTIPSHAFYQTLTRIGRVKAEKLYYTVLTQYLNQRSNFRTARNATLSACRLMYDSATCSQVRDAFAVVGL
jgi:Zn-dependent metalloprotease